MEVFCEMLGLFKPRILEKTTHFSAWMNPWTSKPQELSVLDGTQSPKDFDESKNKPRLSSRGETQGLFDLNELDYFVKHDLKASFYIRYVDDFVLLNGCRKNLVSRGAIDNFLRNNLKIELHKGKTKIIPLTRGVDFVGFRNFFDEKLLRTRNIRKMRSKILLFEEGRIAFEELFDIFAGWRAYAKWSDSEELEWEFKQQIVGLLWKKV